MKNNQYLKIILNGHWMLCQVLLVKKIHAFNYILLIRIPICEFMREKVSTISFMKFLHLKNQSSYYQNWNAWLFIIMFFLLNVIVIINLSHNILLAEWYFFLSSGKLDEKHKPNYTLWRILAADMRLMNKIMIVDYFFFMCPTSYGFTLVWCNTFWPVIAVSHENNPRAINYSSSHLIHKYVWNLTLVKVLCHWGYNNT